MKGWSVVKLSEIAFITSSKRIFAREYQSEGIPFYRGKEIIEKHNGNEVSTELYISRERYEEIKSKFDVPHKGDILLSSVGTLGVAWLVDEEDFYFKDGNLTWLRCNNKIMPEFLYLWLNSKEAQNQIEVKCIGSTQKALTIDMLNKFDVTLPPIVIQKKICDMISPIVQKMNTNRRINRNLQEQVQSVFLEWLSQEAESSETISLAEVCIKVTDGSHFSPKDEPNSTIPMLSVKDMREFDFDLTSCKHISEDDYQKMLANDCVPQVNDILVAKDGSYLKEIFICNEQREIAILSSIAIFRPNTDIIYPEILLAFLKSPRVLQEVRDNYVSGSALPRIVLKDFKKLVFALPNRAAQNKIAPLLSSIRKEIAVNVAENQRLQIIRDTLLPKLMSGELNVSDLDI